MMKRVSSLIMPYMSMLHDIKSVNISETIPFPQILAHGVRYALPAYDSIPGSRVRPLFSGHDSVGPAVVANVHPVKS